MKRKSLPFWALWMLCFGFISMGQAQYKAPLSGSFGADQAFDDSQRREISSSVLVWDANIVPDPTGFFRVQGTSPTGFTTMSVLWSAKGQTSHPTDFIIKYRVREKGQNWSEFKYSEGAYHPKEVTRELYVSELIIISDHTSFDDFEVYILPPAGETVNRIEVDLINLTAEYYHARKSPQAQKPAVKSPGGLEFPSIVDRTEWCLTNACLNPQYTVNYIDATHTLIHYGATPNDYTSGAAIVYAYWDYHVNTLGWFDIGYNYLIDKFGNLFEGRHNPELPLQDVRAAHAGASNAVSIGINFLGNTDAPALYPSPEQLEKNISLLAWWYDYKELDPTSSAEIILQDPAGEMGERYRISGHMDVGTTDCPGTVLYSMLPEMRLQVAESLVTPDLYTIGSESLDGEQGNYPSFRDAVTALNNQETFDNDILLLITSDLEEDCTSSGIGIAVDPSPYTITIKPAPGITPTITFHYPADVNAGPSGAFVVGISHENNIAWADATTTRNIIFDGSNTTDGTTRDLTITNTTGTHRNGMPFLLVGDVADIILKNLNIYHQATHLATEGNVGFNGALAFRINHNVSDSNAPHGITVDNCHLSVDFEGVTAGYNGINVFKSGTGSAGYISDISITNNLIEGKANGIFLAWASDNILIEGNEISVNQDIGATVGANAGVQLPLTLAGSNISVAANSFSKVSNLGTSAAAHTAAIDITSGGNFLVANNMITGFEVSGDGPFAGNLSGIRINNATAEVLLVYNSVLLNELENITESTDLVYKGLDLVSGNVNIQNNIWVAEEDNFAYNLANIGTLPEVMDHNLYYLTSSENATLGYYNGSVYTDLTQWQSATGLEDNSLFEDPLFVSATDLSIENLSPAKSAGTPIAEVTVDMFGTNRNELHPCIGAHENLSVVFAGVYSVGTGSVEGEVGNYPTFREAVTALNEMSTFTEDVVLYITSDLIEDCTASGIGLAVDPSPHTITIKPAPGTTPTLAFHYPADINAGPSGAFIVGIPHTNNISWADATPTRNVIFDGSNTQGGTTRDLTITNTSQSQRNAMPMLLLGDVENVVVKNLNIYHQATHESSPTQVGFNGALAFRVNHNTDTDNAPRNIHVENCHISVDFPNVSPGYNAINVFKSGAGSAGYISDINIVNNLIEGKANGLFLAWAGDNIHIDGNEIKINQNISPDIAANAAIQLPLSHEDANIGITANLISKISHGGTSSATNISAIDIASGGHYLVANNMITGFEVTGDAPYAGSMQALRISNASALVLLAYNSILLNALDNVTETTNLQYRGFNLAEGAVNMYNNILAAQEDAFAFSLLDMTVLPEEMDHNLYHLSSLEYASLASYDGDSYSDITDWQTNTGMDNQSLFADPLFVSDINLMIQDISPAKFAGTPLEEITGDMFGNERDENNPSIGAHENQSVTVAGVFSIGEESVEGEAGNFTSLREAVAFLNSDITYTGDVTMLITSDLLEDCTTAEEPGIGLAVDPSPFTITFKPAPEKTPVVTFDYYLASNPASEPNSGGPSGAFVIGIDHPTIAWAGAQTTRNIVFDGSNTPGGTTRDLTFTNTTGTHRNGMPMLLVGDVGDITIKNMNVYHQATNQSSPTQVGFNGAIALRVNHNIEQDNAPHNITIDNCHISVDFPDVSPGYNGINVFKSNAGANGYLSNIAITNNLIEGKANGMFLAWVGNNILIEGNEIRANQDTGTGILANAALQFPLGLPEANIMVSANQFTKTANIGTASNVSMSAMDIVAGGNYLIANNMITGFDIIAESGHQGFLRGVRVNNVDANVMFVYNSIMLNELENISGTTQLNYKGLDLIAGNLLMQNNIWASDEGDFTFNLLDMAQAASSEYNLFYLPEGSNAQLGSYNGTEYASLPEWQNATGMENNSLFADPLFVSASDLMIQDNSPAKGAGTPVEQVTVDMFGTERDPEAPCMGAHENLSDTPLFTVTFIVENEQGDAVDNAIITLGEITLEPGNYVFENTAPGDYNYTVTAEGYQTADGSLQIADEDITLTVTLTPSAPTTYTVTFVVTDPDDTNIDDATITLNGHTNPIGEYVFEDMPAGNYDYLVEASGFFPVSGSLEVIDSDVSESIILTEDDTHVWRPDMKASFSLYPNPAFDIVNIRSENRINSIAIADINGRIVYSNSSVNQTEYRFNVSQLETGIYIVHLYTRQGRSIEKLQVKR